MSNEGALFKKYSALSQDIVKVFTNMFCKYILMVPQLAN